MIWRIADINTGLGIALAILSLFTFFQSKMTASERRLTVLEEENKQKTLTLEEYKDRLNKHDKQNETLIMLTQQMTSLTEKVEKIDNKLEEVK
ncbi:DUF7365 family protein [Streptococcus gallolyticus]|uniref:DUF7365 family protein n=1 Tax=Streptococcus gallolyticus TaxID=315405 RepID=UPI00088F28CD|nr:hypothetical protein [Streptococcus gallolyticus]SDJ74025.1 hypothetical protein SAMN04487842_0746 [Streptococcus gallolyticus]SDL24410.1 hypothetical protein SAMN04487841_0748 [Streptococcus gallolyticus]